MIFVILVTTKEIINFLASRGISASKDDKNTIELIRNLPFLGSTLYRKKRTILNVKDHSI
jgi:hypothetical protein